MRSNFGLRKFGYGKPVKAWITCSVIQETSYKSELSEELKKHMSFIWINWTPHTQWYGGKETYTLEAGTSCEWFTNQVP